METTTRRILVLLGTLTLGLMGALPSARAEEPTGAAFDRTFSTVAPTAEGGVGVAGRVVTRFAPPVAAPVDPASTTIPVALTRGPLLRPCDTPGSGCSNPQVASTPVGVPPIGPGTRPPTTPNP
ncbi:MAG: hypothetical protein U0900_14350 [Myxococcota bacterium]